MTTRILFFLFLLLWGANGTAQNGSILSQEDFHLKNYPELFTDLINETEVFKTKYNYLNEVKLQTLFYESDDLKVKAYMAHPKDTTRSYPVIIYNRGGNREFGSLSEYKMAYILAKVASWGYVVTASQYRGNDGGEGIEEFGGADVNDIINLMAMTETLPFADSESMGMYGWSRGGMMTYLALMKTKKIKAAAVGGAVSNLKVMDESRNGEMGEHVFSQLILGYERNKDSVMAVRSAVFHADKLPKTTPILLLHGTADWRVIPEESLNMALALQKEKVPYRLVMLEGGDHGLSEYRDEVNELVKDWFLKYVTNGQALPNLEPHGK
ncbi:hypothetical protein MNBD_BACTEROID03-2225 [hydrothermal vent metagenome]|uniref:Peptidase S9 prolyl oligopeptidase catalytic domain-containing protein n=1 Tax=hydrothermal vent metagenome TaxID=652676 RepID=A0A3B0T612_9ZZZZ